MSSYKQADRNIGIDVDGMVENSLLLSEIIEGVEELSRQFLFRVETLSLDDLKPENLLGKKATIRITLEKKDDGERYINGIITSFAPVGRYNITDKEDKEEKEESFGVYEMEISPRLWLASHRLVCRVFHKQKALEIVRSILGEWNVDCKMPKNLDFPKLEQVVQYEESDYDFINRLLESMGLFYRFVHSETGHTMEILDTNPALPSPEFTENFKYRQSSAAGEFDIPFWRASQSLGFQNVAFNEYNFKSAKTQYLANSETKQKSALAKNDAGKLSYSLFPFASDLMIKKGDFKPHVAKMADRLAGSLRNRQFAWSGETANRSVTAGKTFTLEDFPLNGGSLPVMVIKTVLKAKATPYSAGGKDDKFAYQCQISAIDHGVKFQVAQLTPSPNVSSTAYGVVVTVDPSINPSSQNSSVPSVVQGEKKPDEDDEPTEPQEIQCDKWGRVYVELRWNWPNEQRKSQVLLARVLQPRTGNKSGDYSLPRRGQEVAISFMGGNPDNPVVVGCLFNSENLPPVDLSNSRGVYSNIIRDASVNEYGVNKYIKQKLPLPAEKDVKELAEGDKRLNYNEISMLNMLGDFEEKSAADKKADKLKQIPLPLCTAIAECNESSESEREPLGSDDRPMEGISIYSNNSLLSQATQEQVIKAGTNVIIEAGKSLTLRVGNSQITMSNGTIDVRSKSESGIGMWDSSLSLIAGEAELNAMLTGVKGFIRTEIKTTMALSKIVSCFYRTEVETMILELEVKGFDLKTCIVGIISVALTICGGIASWTGSRRMGGVMGGIVSGVATAVLVLDMLKTINLILLTKPGHHSKVTITNDTIHLESKNVGSTAHVIKMEADPFAGKSLGMEKWAPAIKAKYNNWKMSVKEHKVEVNKIDKIVTEEEKTTVHKNDGVIVENNNKLDIKYEVIKQEKVEIQEVEEKIDQKNTEIVGEKVQVRNREENVQVRKENDGVVTTQSNSTDATSALIQLK